MRESTGSTVYLGPRELHRMLVSTLLSWIQDPLGGGTEALTALL